LRMVARRSLNGSVTVVGDIAQATGPFAPSGWDEVLAHLPDRRPPRVIGLSVGYRIPAQIMALADRVMNAAAPGLRAPRAVRVGDADPAFVAVDGAAAMPDGVAAAVTAMRDQLGPAAIGVIAVEAMIDRLSAALSAAGIDHGRAATGGLGADVTLVAADVAKGLELDGVVVVEPAAIVAAHEQGLRSLYVCLTRSTRRLTVVHAEALPPAMNAV
jgi:DNA helicase IV